MADSEIDGIDLTVLQNDVATLKQQVAALSTISDAHIVSVIAAALGGSALTPVVTNPSTPASPVTPTNTDPNVYPFTQPSNLAAGAIWETGTGPNRLEILVSNNPLSISGGSPPDEFAVRITPQGAPAILAAAPVFVKSDVGETTNGCDNIVLHGPWGSNPTVDIIPAGDGGVGGLWIMGMTIDYNPMVFNGVDDSRGGTSTNAATTFDSAAVTTSWTLPVAVAASPAAPSLTQINGQTLAQLLASAVSGSVVSLPGQTIAGTGKISAACTIAGTTGTLIDATNLPLPESKAILLPTVPGVTISNLALKGAQLTSELGSNGAGIRDEADSIGFTAKNVEIYGCQNGILTFKSNIVLDTCHLHDNGNADASTGDGHNAYIGGGTLTATNNTVERATSGHGIKSRAQTNVCSGNTITSGPEGACYDFPDAGTVTIDGDHLITPADADDRNVITYATESMNNAPFGTALKIKNTLFENLSGQSTYIFTNNGGSVSLSFENCTFKGVVPDFSSFKSVTGTLTPAQ